GTIETIRAPSLCGTVSSPASVAVTTARYKDWIQDSGRVAWNAIVPPTTVSRIAAESRKIWRSLSPDCTPLVFRRGRRARAARRRDRGAPPQHPSRPLRYRGVVCELREHQLLALRVHAHVCAHRARGRGGRRPGRRRRPHQRVPALLRGAHLGAAGFLDGVPDH